MMGRVGILCEYSGIERDAYILAGHEAISCDLLATESPGPHYQGDVIEFLNTYPDGWFDLIIFHPPCTAVGVCGNGTYGEGKPKHHKRLTAANWTKMAWNLCKRKGKRVCLENPVSVLARLAGIPKASYVHPWQHGHKEQKKTGLHLHNLPPLQETSNVYKGMMLLPKKEREKVFYMSPGPDRGKHRSKAYQGIADAMADQWGKLL